MYDSINHAFMRLDTAQPTDFSQQASWPMSRGSGSCTPTAVYEQFPHEFDASATAAFGGAMGQVPNNVGFSPMSYRPGTVFTAAGGVAMSPQTSQGWVRPASEMTDASKQTRSPQFRSDSNLTVRRDGIRKKNARFEIPPERTLSNIDQLIAQSTNEEEIKELKQQKRLLRNRQAALDSRQRKKLHTEKLEEEKKQFTAMIAEMEETIHNMKLREAELLREKAQWMATQQQFNQYIENLHMEKDELIRAHTLETAELRKKNNILRETMEKMEQQLRNAGIGGFNEFGDFENQMGMDHDWEDFSMVNALSLEPEPTSTSRAEDSSAVKSEKAGQTSSSQQSSSQQQNNEHPFSWNAFYMCLLFGAFIASNSASLSTTKLPQLSEEYRAESANVLKAVLASSTVDTGATTTSSGASGSASLPATISGAEMAQITSGPAATTSSLDELHDTLAMPSKQQEDAQVFALNPDQYNALTTFDESVSGDGNHGENKDKAQKPTNLQQAFEAMRNQDNRRKMNGARATSDVYSRSLLWDRVPEKVLRDFKRMVRECGASAEK